MARTLNGTTDQLSLAGSYALLNPRAVPYWWLGCRFKRTSGSDPVSQQAIVSIGQQGLGGATAGVAMYITATSTVAARFADGTNFIGRTLGSVADTNWHAGLIVLDRVNEVLIPYLDSATAGSTAAIGSLGSVDPSSALTVGRDNAGTLYFPGTVGEFFIGFSYERAPTTAELTAWVAGTAAGQAFDPSHLAGWWPMCGTSLQSGAGGYYAYPLTATGTTIATDGTLLWAASGDDESWDSLTLGAVADGTALESVATDGGRDIVEHASVTSGALEVRGGYVRRVTSNANASLDYIDVGIGSRSVEVSCTLAKTSAQAVANANLLVGLDPSALNYVMVGHDGTNARWSIASVVAGSATVISYESSALSDDVDASVVAQRSGNRWILAVDGQLKCMARAGGLAIDNLASKVGYRIAGTADGSNSNGYRISGISVRRGPLVEIMDIGNNGGGSSTWEGFHLPTIGETSGYVHVIAEGRYGDTTDQAPSDIIHWRAPKGSWPMSFTRTAIIEDDGSRDAIHNPNPFFLADGSTIVLINTDFPDGSDIPISNQGKVWRRVSTDEGATWGSPAEITSEVQIPGQGYGFIAGPGRGCVTATGRLILPISQRSSASLATARTTSIFYSDDDGVTWTQSATALDDTADADGVVSPNECQVERAWDDTLIANLRVTITADNNGRVIYTSSDDGETWALDRIEYGLEAPAAPSESTNVFTSLRRAYREDELVHSAPASVTRSRMEVAVSADGGETWDHGESHLDRIGGGYCLESGQSAAYSDCLATTVDGEDVVLVAYVGGYRLITPTPTGDFPFYDSLFLAAVPRTWLGLTAAEPEPEADADEERYPGLWGESTWEEVLDAFDLGANP